jgi:hypothetical protein
MRTALLILLLAPGLVARDITTLDGRIYRNCQVSQVYPDSICVLFAGSGARIKFSSLPEPLQTEFGYDPQRAAEFERVEAARKDRERALLAAQRQQAQVQGNITAAISNQRSVSQSSPNTGNTGNAGAEYVGVRLAGPGAGNQSANQTGGRYGRGGAQYVGVRMAAPGGIYGLTYGPTRPRP